MPKPSKPAAAPAPEKIPVPQDESTGNGETSGFVPPALGVTYTPPMPAEIWLTKSADGEFTVHVNVGVPPDGSTRYVYADKVHAMVHHEIGRRMAKKGLDHDGNPLPTS
jgi:hypothetical protein